jgi:hypothetical protein
MEPSIRDVNCGRSRLAASSAPDIVPIAIIEDSRPKPRASVWKTPTAMVEVKIGKFKPKVPIRNSITRVALRSGRD